LRLQWLQLTGNPLLYRRPADVKPSAAAQEDVERGVQAMQLGNNEDAGGAGSTATRSTDHQLASTSGRPDAESQQQVF